MVNLNKVNEKLPCEFCKRQFKHQLSLKNHQQSVHRGELTEKRKNNPTLVKCGKHFIDPRDVSSIKEAKPGLFIVKLKSEPNPEWPLWIEEKDIQTLIQHFNIEE